MGPNSVGTINPSANFDASLGRLNKIFLPDADIKPGSVGFVGQTGLFTGVFLPLINSELGISKIACLGNKCDVDESDLLEYLGDDPPTRVIAMYLESIKDGRRFLSLSRRISKGEADSYPEIGRNRERGQGIGHPYRLHSRRGQGL